MRPRDRGSAEQNIPTRTQINILIAGENLRTGCGPKTCRTAARRSKRVSGSGYRLGKRSRTERRPLATDRKVTKCAGAVRRQRNKTVARLRGQPSGDLERRGPEGGIETAFEAVLTASIAIKTS